MACRATWHGCTNGASCDFSQCQLLFAAIRRRRAANVQRLCEACRDAPFKTMPWRSMILPPVHQSARCAALISLVLASCVPLRQPQPWTVPPAQSPPPVSAVSAGGVRHSVASPLVVDLASQLEGSRIVANDGQFLGVITRNQFAANSILNEFGAHGSQFRQESIFNTFGQYGSEFSQLSPFNRFAQSPPLIIAPNGARVAFLTKNQFKTPCVDPHVLIASLRAK